MSDGVALNLIVNPASQAARRGRVPAVERSLTSQGYDVRTVQSTSGDDLERLAAEADADDVIAVLGGDGSIALAARGAHRSGAVLLPLPGGRGNDLCDWIGIGTDPVAAAGRVSSYTVQQIDAATANGTLFLGVATIGFDSLANGYANEFRVIKGKSVYVAGALKALARWKGARFPLKVDGKTIEADGFSVVVGNTGQYGGGLKICPRAKIDDGLLDVMVGGRVSRRELVGLLPKIADGKHLDHPQVQYLTGKRIEIDVPEVANAKLAPRVLLYADGDPVAAPPVTIEVIPDALRILGPPTR